MKYHVDLLVLLFLKLTIVAAVLDQQCQELVLKQNEYSEKVILNKWKHILASQVEF